MKITRNLKNKIVIIASMLIALIVCITLQYAQKEKLRISSLSSEMQRAMSYEQFTDSEAIVEGTGNHVQFGAFFLRDLNGDGYAEKLKGTSKQIGSQDTLYMDINVLTSGYLKDAKIEIDGKNFYFNTVLPKDNELKDSYIGANVKTIELNQLNNGTQKTLMGFVKSGDYSYDSQKYSAIGNNINNYSRNDNKVVLTGTYYESEESEGIAIRKEITLNMDWYGTTKAELASYFKGKNYQNQDIDIAGRIDEGTGTIKLDFDIVTTENNNELLLSKNNTEAEIPELNGYAPIKVEATGTNIEYSYNAENKKLIIVKTAETNEEGSVTKNAYEGTYYEKKYNKYNISVTYPIEAYQSLGEDTVTIKVPIETYYEGYNNTNREFNNPYKSNVAKSTIVANFKKPEGTVAIVEVQVGKHVYNPTTRYIVSKDKPLKIYNSISESESDDKYIVRWRASTGTDGAGKSFKLKETKNDEEQKADSFIKADSTEETMENVTTNVGIYFTGADTLLKEDGWIKVYDDETNELLETFTKDNWSTYTESNPYKYKTPVKHIRVETSETNATSSLYVYNIKELDDSYITENYTREQFDNLRYIKSTLSGYIGESYLNTDTQQAVYEAPYSVAEISLSNRTLSTQVTEKNEEIVIRAVADDSTNKVGWKNGSFLVKIPNEILSTEIKNISINNSNVQITSYELLEEGNNKFIKINTENNNESNESYTITINTNTTPDPRSVTVTRNYELYASNEAVVDYYYKENDIYDVNNNLNTEEQINKTVTSINLVSPNSLLTNQTITEYDDKGSIAVSPQIADVKPIYANVDNKQNEATIGVQLKNNYSSDISEVLLLGKIPFEGNTYAITGADLGSSFTTKMKSPGIEVPEELQGKVTIYYSENEKPSKDLNNSTNGWKTANQVTDWSKIKTYAIDFGETVLTPQKEYVFNYKVSLPNGVEFNKVSYAHHGIYFALHTDQGKYRTQTEPNKIGVRVAQKFNLELTKYQISKDKKVAGATYSVIAEGEEEGKTATTNENGLLTINNLYAEKTYIIKEIKSPTNYELNTNEIKLIGHVNQETGALTIEKKEGNTKGNITVTKQEGEDYKVSIQVEDEVKAKLKITKTEQGTDAKLAKVVYKLTGEEQTSKRATTKENGEAIFTGLNIGKEYTLEEVKAQGYYLASPIKFKINNNNGTYSAEIVEGTIKSNTITEEDSIPTLNLSLEDEKIPTYNLELTKIKKVTNLGEENTEETTYLAGAKFRLFKGEELLGNYTSDENGKIRIDNLYQYADGKDFDATYILKEVLAPEGYSKVKDITFKVEKNTDGKLEFKEELGEGQTTKKYTTDEESNTVKVIVEDSPSFKLIKKDAETNEVLANCKFAIYNVDQNSTPATNSKGEIIGEKQTINGREYYVVTTDSNGEITADLTEGFYKAVEVEAPEKYELAGKPYYFGIGVSKEAQTEISPDFATSYGGNNYDLVNAVTSTTDGGYIVGGAFGSTNITIGGTQLSGRGAYDGLLIKYSQQDEIAWFTTISGTKDEVISSVKQTQDGGYIVAGYFYSNIIYVNDLMIKNDDSDILVLKFSPNGELEWFNGSTAVETGNAFIDDIIQTIDGGYIATGYFFNKIQVGDTILAGKGSSNGLIIKYNSAGEVEWAKSISSRGTASAHSVTQKENGSIIAVGSFQGTINVDNITLTSTSYDGFILSFTQNGEAEWGTRSAGTSSEDFKSIKSTDDGGYIVAGYTAGSTMQISDTTISGRSNGIIIKYTSENEAEWVKVIKSTENISINSIDKTKSGGYIVTGQYKGTLNAENIQLFSENVDNGLMAFLNRNGEFEWVKEIKGDDTTTINSATETFNQEIIVAGRFWRTNLKIENTKLTNQGNADIFLLKYSPKEIPTIDVKWAENVGGSDLDLINSLSPTSDGGVIAGGYFSGTMKVGDTMLTSKGEYDGVIIKYTSDGNVEWAKSFGGNNNDAVNSVAVSKDGGYTVGGYFNGTINIGNQILTGRYQEGIVIKYSEDGEIEWIRSYGGSASDLINSVTQTLDGGYIAAGRFYEQNNSSRKSNNKRR